MRASTPFLKLFWRSPFRPMQEHMAAVISCVGEVPGMIEALCAGDQDKVKEFKERIFAFESEADTIKDNLRAHLPMGLLLPVDRRDLLEILHIQDSIADTAQDIAKLLVTRPMVVPADMSELLLALTRRSAETCAQASQIIQKFDELVEAGFSGSRAMDVNQIVGAVERSETKTIDMVSELAVLLFAQEDELKPVSVFLWYRLIELIGDLADDAEKVGYRVRLLIGQ
jgi:predicted phosphate transport protein (TIGR00153 family)